MTSGGDFAEIMNIIELDASYWNSIAEFYRALLDQLGAPEWHGRNVNALVDSMVYGDINRVDPPLTVMIKKLHSAGIEVQAELRAAIGALVSHGAHCSIGPGDNPSVKIEWPLPNGVLIES